MIHKGKGIRERGTARGIWKGFAVTGKGVTDVEPETDLIY
jgi:hypothetical protein